MDPTAVFCPNFDCHARGQIGRGNMGIHSQKEQRFICRACRKTFSATKGTVFYRLRTAAETVVWLKDNASDGGRDHRSLLDDSGTAFVSCVIACLGATEATWASFAGIAASHRAMACVTTVKCGATTSGCY